MKRGRSVARRHTTRADRSAWILLRRWTRFLSLAAAFLSLIGPSRLRRHWLRAAAQDLGKLEQILRSLLLLMRAPTLPPKALPFTAPNRPARRRPGGGPVRFSLTLRKFSWAPVAGPLPSVYGLTTSAALPPRDPAGALKRRLDALRAALADPSRYAARISAAIRAHGLHLRAPKTRIPSSEFWLLARMLGANGAAPHAGAHPDTS
ncbi:MAG: hypothetical protein FP825_16735 [Hyphomonas sp.]|uniref:hypothetical protein n=1 Tax=Hyphomonas sp. TaxID=87 RepID=UPI00179F74E3|nr:hypothetical protein [Hyphomonas sp.]MBU3922255.1 hypothetical protein [Alphaproteobacteria bacterium]MBA3070117.1 hypothetical protein [Hyphomonas sp.]MBU4060307.1 hypothetical protein [Alphaproteobacteria bacterium]MBU4162975.1 hypothetical protein [Alphaproteobacteria bacterium]MBU4567460.1 hypothetical protein [Alphaproteobacteria bacterium]